jgi:hypothetical protein
MKETELNLDTLGVYLVEGFVEVDPLTNKVYISTVDQHGMPTKFDPVPVLNNLRGKDIRIVIAPLASVAQLEELARNIEQDRT